MAESSESIKMGVLQNAAGENPKKSVKVEASEAKHNAMRNLGQSLSTETEAEDVVMKDLASVDTTDKKRQENNFAAKKTVAQGMMDVALITANANQLRYLIEYQSGTSTFYFIVILIAVSLLLQVTKCRGYVAQCSWYKTSKV